MVVLRERIPVDAGSMTIVPEEAIKRLRSLERLDESPFLQRKLLKAAQGMHSARGGQDTSGESTASKRRSGVPDTMAAGRAPHGGMARRHPKRAANAQMERGRWPRELPWLVTPPPAPTQNVTSSILAPRLASNCKKSRNRVSGEVNIVASGEESHGSLEIGHDHGRAKRRATMSEVGSSPSSVSNSGTVGDAVLLLRRRDNEDGEGGCFFSASAAGAVLSKKRTAGNALQAKSRRPEDNAMHIGTEADCEPTVDAEAEERERRLDQAFALACASNMELALTTEGPPSTLGLWSASTASGKSSSVFRMPSSAHRGRREARGGRKMGTPQTLAFGQKAGSMLSASERTPVLPLEYLEANLLDLRAFHCGPQTADPLSRESLVPPFLLPENDAADPILHRDGNRDPAGAAEGENVTDDTRNRDFELSTQEESRGANEISLRSEGEYTLEARSVAGQGKNHANSSSTTLTHPSCYSTVHKYRNRGGVATAGATRGYWTRSVSRGSSALSRSPGSPPGVGPGRPVTRWGGTLITPMTGACDCECLGGIATSATTTASGTDEIVSSVYFRTADGRSLFAESLAAVSVKAHGSSDSNNEMYAQAGASGMLGAKSRCSGARAGLGLEARQRRARIDARSRDEKRREEWLLAKTKVARLRDELLSRRADKIERRQMATKSRGVVDTINDRGRLLLQAVALASRTGAIGKLLVKVEDRRDLDRMGVVLCKSTLAIQRAWRFFRREKEGAEAITSAINEIERKHTLLSRTGRTFVICRRARIVALLRLWPEGETEVKIELRTGQRISSKREQHSSLRGEFPGSSQCLIDKNSGGRSGCGSGMMAAAAPWFPQLAQRIEGRRMDTIQNLQRGQDKVFRLRQANEQRGGSIQIHSRKSAFLLQLPSCGSSVVSTASNATSTTMSTATLTGRKESSLVTGLNSNSSDKASSRSPANGRRLDSKNIVATSERRKGQQTSKNRGRTPTLSSNTLDGGEEHSAEEVESRPSSTSVHNTVGDAHSGGECHVGASELRTKKAERDIAVNIRGGHNFSPPPSAALQQGGKAKKVPVREMTSLQLLQGHGWASRVSELANDLDASPLVPLSLKLATVAAFLKGERARQAAQSEHLRQAARLNHGGKATVHAVKTLLHGTLEDVMHEMEAAHSSRPAMSLQLFTGEPRKRFKAEVDSKVRAHLEKTNRRGLVFVRS